jgi:acetylornithine aminotransferase
VIGVIEKEKILLQVNEVSSYLFAELALVPGVTEVRGAGLLIGVSLDKDCAKDLVKKSQAMGLLINAPSESIIRIAPALNISLRDAKKFVTIFTAALAQVRHG